MAAMYDGPTARGTVAGGPSAAAAAASALASGVGAAAAAASSAASSSSALSSRYVYAVSAQPPTLVTHTAVCHFTSRSELNLLLVRSTRLEVYRVAGGSEGLDAVLDVPIYGRVTALVVLKAKVSGATRRSNKRRANVLQRARVLQIAHCLCCFSSASARSCCTQGSGTDRLFLTTERHKFFVLSYDVDTKEIVTLATGDSKLKIGRLSDQGCLALLDPTGTWLALHQYGGLVQMLAIDPQTGSLARELHEVKLDTLAVLQMVWLYGQAKPTLLVLAKSDDGTNERCLRSFTYEAREKELKPAPGAVNLARCDPGASHIIPTQFGGVVVVAEQSVTYVSVGGKSSSSVSLAVPPWFVTAWGAVDRERFLLGDLEGGLHALLLSSSGEGGVVTGLKVEFLGTTSIAHRLQYVDNSFVMVGSQYADSQLIKLHREPQPLPGEEEEQLQEEDADAAAAGEDAGPAAMEVDGADATAAPAAAAAVPAPSRAVATSSLRRPNFITIESTFEHLGQHARKCLRKYTLFSLFLFISLSCMYVCLWMVCFRSDRGFRHAGSRAQRSRRHADLLGQLQGRFVARGAQRHRCAGGSKH
jgi:hypothetical protein